MPLLYSSLPKVMILRQNRDDLLRSKCFCYCFVYPYVISYVDIRIEPVRSMMQNEPMEISDSKNGYSIHVPSENYPLFKGRTIYT